ncbi:hypothetical protein [Streptomyces sp. NRRL F-5630]|uniref:hypothetical protein n=1 Tax=Streptomyces sp. NRRL F-5630 TaxID=1463864 RepID=UPI003D755503
MSDQQPTPVTDDAHATSADLLARAAAVGRITAGRRLTIRITPDAGPLLRLPAEPRARRRLMAWRQI